MTCSLGRWVGLIFILFESRAHAQHGHTVSPTNIIKFLIHTKRHKYIDNANELLIYHKFLSANCLISVPTPSLCYHSVHILPRLLLDEHIDTTQYHESTRYAQTNNDGYDDSEG